MRLTPTFSGFLLFIALAVAASVTVQTGFAQTGDGVTVTVDADTPDNNSANDSASESFMCDLSGSSSSPVSCPAGTSACDAMGCTAVVCNDTKIEVTPGCCTCGANCAHCGIQCPMTATGCSACGFSSSSQQSSQGTQCPAGQYCNRDSVANQCLAVNPCGPGQTFTCTGGSTCADGPSCTGTCCQCTGGGSSSSAAACTGSECNAGTAGSIFCSLGQQQCVPTPSGQCYQCVATSCGNRKLDSGEDCDDGNIVDDGNGCTADCLFSNPYCELGGGSSSAGNSSAGVVVCPAGLLCTLDGSPSGCPSGQPPACPSGQVSQFVSTCTQAIPSGTICNGGCYRCVGTTSSSGLSGSGSCGDGTCAADEGCMSGTAENCLVTAPCPLDCAVGSALAGLCSRTNDPGGSIYIKGNMQVSPPGGGFNYAITGDLCSSVYLRETACVISTQMVVWNTITCPGTSECHNGACTSQ